MIKFRTALAVHNEQLGLFDTKRENIARCVLARYINDGEATPAVHDAIRVLRIDDPFIVRMIEQWRVTRSWVHETQRREIQAVLNGEEGAPF